MDRDKPSNVNKFSVYPSKYITVKVEIIEVGMETRTINEFLILCKKMSMTSDTRITAYIRSVITASAAFMVN
jgi:hypothetical protein